MIILVQPMYSKPELNADSNYVVYSSLIRAMHKHKPHWHWVVVFPDRASGFKYEDDGFFRLPNVTRLPQRIAKRKFGNAVSYNAAWFDKLFKTHGFHAVWCNLVETAGALREAGVTTNERPAKPGVVAAHNYTIHETLPYGFERMAYVAYLQVAGALFAEANVFNSEWCKEMLFDNARRWLRPAHVEAIEAKSHMINYGTLPPGLAYHDTGNKVPVIAYNHRLQLYKNWHTTFALFDKLNAAGHRFRVQYMANTTDKVAFMHERPYVDVVLTRTHAEYLDALKGCDLNVINSQHETFCIAAIESMAYGQPLLAPNSVTFPEITGASKGNGYPFLFASLQQQEEMLIKLLKDGKARRQWGRVVSQHVTELYNSDLWASKYAALFQQVGSAQTGVKQDAKEFVDETLDANRGQDIQTLLSKVRGVKVNGRIPFGSQSMTPTKLIRLAEELGYTVTMARGKQAVI